jgi:hypothetical protein
MRNGGRETDEPSDNGGAADRLVVVLTHDRVGTTDETADRDRRRHQTDCDCGTLEQHTIDPGRMAVPGGPRNVSNRSQLPHFPFENASAG